MTEGTAEGTILRCDTCDEPVLVARGADGGPVLLNIDSEKRMVFRKDSEGSLVAIHRETWSKHEGCGPNTITEPSNRSKHLDEGERDAE